MSVPPDEPGAPGGASTDPTVPTAGAADTHPNETGVASTSARSRRTRTVVTLLAVLVLVGAGIGIAVAMTGGSGGNATPQAAVSALLTAAENRDLVGALDTLVPGERGAIEPGLDGLVTQLKRLRVLSSAADPSNVTGLDLAFHNVLTSTTYLSPTVAAVRITHGTVTTDANPARLPLGTFVTGLTGELPNKTQHQQQSASMGPEAIAAVKVNGSWYVSLGYTIAVDNLRSSGKSAAIPPPDGSVPPLGADSPQDAVGALLSSLGALDLDALVADVAPGEGDALRAYAPLFLEKGQTALAPARKQFSVSFSNLATTSTPIGAMTLVKLEKADVRIAAAGTSIAISGNCVTITSGGKSTRRCGKGPTPKSPVSSQAQQILKALPPDLRALSEHLAGKQTDLGFMTVESGGKWFVSPTATVLHDVNSALGLLRPGDLTTIAKYAKNPALAQRTFERIAQVVSGGSGLS